MKDRLRQIIKEYQDRGICLALSGGCDSVLLLAILAEMRAEQPFPLLAVHARTPFQTLEEWERCRRLATRFQVELESVSPDILSLPEVRNNASDRCYHCKKMLFTAIRDLAAERGTGVLFDGTNSDDCKVYRPGRQALAELGVISPLALAQMTKTQVRQLAAEYVPEVADLPAASCLATRFPYGTCLTVEQLRRLESAETLLRPFMTGNFRVRIHHDLVRIEAEEQDLSAALDARETILEKLKTLDFRYITLDLEPFRSGSFDR